MIYSLYFLTPLYTAVIFSNRPSNIFEAHVVRMPLVQKLSFTANGIPSSGPLGVPNRDGKWPHKALTYTSQFTKGTQKGSTNITPLESCLCLLGLSHGGFFRHCDIGIEMASSLDAIQTFSAKLCGGELAFPQCTGDLAGCNIIIIIMSVL